MRHAVAASTERDYLGHFGAWVHFRVRCGVPVFLDRGIDGMTNLWNLFEYVAYAFATEKLRSATIKSHLSAIQVFHRISRGFELDITHPVIASPLKGAALPHAEEGNQATVRRPVSCAMWLAGETLVPAWRYGGRVLWLGLWQGFGFDPRVRNVRGDLAAYPRNVLFTAGRRGFLSRSGTAGGDAMVESHPASTFDSVALRATSCAKGPLFRAFVRVNRGPWGPVAMLPILWSS